MVIDPCILWLTPNDVILPEIVDIVTQRLLIAWKLVKITIFDELL